MRKLPKKKWVLLGVLLILVAFATWFLIRFLTINTNIAINNLYEWPELPSLSQSYEVESGNYAVAVDGKMVLNNYSGEQEARPTASTAKMILGLAIMEAKPFELGESGEIITITQEDYDKYAWYLNNNGSNTPVQVGEEISEYDALVSVLLASSNNMADTLAVWAFGSMDDYKKFAEKMLQDFGISHTTIGEDACGFSDTTTSTPEDLAILGTKLLENPVLAEIVEVKEHEVPVAGVIRNTNKLLGINNIIGIKTGYIGDASGYCLVSGYKEGDHIITVALMNADSRDASFDESLAIVNHIQELAKSQKLTIEGQVVGYLESWWIGTVPIVVSEELNELAYNEANKSSEIVLGENENWLKIKIADREYKIPVQPGEYNTQPTFGEKFQHVFGWEKEKTEVKFTPVDAATIENDNEENKVDEANEIDENFTAAPSDNCTIKYGKLMLINPNFTVETDFINARRGELISISAKYGIVEGNPGNGDNLLDAEAAEHINEMVNAYKEAYPGHTLETRSCFRAVGTNCGRLCAATGASDHHTGLTCDLLDPAYGDSLDTSTYDRHIDWQWLYENSYKYGFIDRFPEAWAGGSMSEPLNVDENGSTGLFETWHYRYVGVSAATEIATGKYNDGQYDSLEHYLKARGLVTNLKTGSCE